MTGTKDTDEKTIRSGGRKQLSLQRTVESGHVRQNFSHGRSKSVVVEKRRTRKLAQPGAAKETKAKEKKAAPTAAPAEPAKAPPKKTKSSVADKAQAEKVTTDNGAVKGLSDEESKKRAEALAAAKLRTPETPATAIEEPKEPSLESPSDTATDAGVKEDMVATKPEASPAKKTKTAAKQPKKVETETEKLSETAGQDGEPEKTTAEPKNKDSRPAAKKSRSNDAALLPRAGGRPQEIEIPADAKRRQQASEVRAEQPTSKRAQRHHMPAAQDEEESRGKGDRRGRSTRTAHKGHEERRERGKLTLDRLLGDEQRQRSLASLKRKREREKLKAMGVVQPREKISREVIIPEVITIQELANRMTERAVDVIKYLMKQGEMHQINDVIDADTAELIVQEFGHNAKRVSESDVEEGFIGKEDSPESLQSRAPVVTIMGHVDHGKTSLLDAVREANVVSGEAGGITQHIGAYQVSTPAGQTITFIDTPGHEAFTAMRARGAKVTDIVVLVVAADDGVMPQTIEAINHAKAAEVPIIVAINKMDKEQADPSRVRNELLRYEVVVESMSGETLEVEVSALKKTNLDKLLEAIALQAELLELTANPDRPADGIVIEAKLERGRGPVGTVLVQRGTLSIGDIVVAGSAWGRVRALINDRGKNTAKAGPSVPVEILGFDSAPEAGDQFAVVENEARARDLTEYRLRKRRETLGSAGTPRTLEQMMQSLKEEGKKEFPLLVKGDVQGSIEAISGALGKLGNDEVEARIVHSGVGGITESDIALANASQAVVIGFNVRANAQAKTAADQEGVEIRYYNIIYDLVDDVKAAMSGLLEPTIREIFLGNAEVLQVFNISKVGKVAGCRVTEGKVERGAKVRLIRDDVVIHEGELSILKRFKDDVKEVPAGQECGMSFAKYQDLREGDIIECFQEERVKRSL